MKEEEVASTRALAFWQLRGIISKIVAVYGGTGEQLLFQLNWLLTATA